MFNNNNNNIPIVQGVAVGGDTQQQQSDYQHHDDGGYYQQQPHSSSPTSYNNNKNESGGHYQNIPDPNATIIDVDQLQQLRQDPIQQYQDVVWAVAFVLHLVAMIAVIVVGMTSSSDNEDGEDAAASLSSLSSSIFVLVAATGLVAVALSVAALSFMMRHTETLVQTALLFSIATSLVVGVLGFLTGSILMGCVGLASFAIGCCYAKVVWPRIPFAAANLGAALACVQCNLGLSALSLLVTTVAFGWTLLWFLGVGRALEGSNAVVLFLLVRVFFTCGLLFVWTTVIHCSIVCYLGVLWFWITVIHCSPI